MRLINERTDVAGIAKRWRDQYPVGCAADKEAIYVKLKALDTTTATATDIANIIGNRTWAGAYECDDCGERVDAVIELGQEPDYESHTAKICRNCLTKALALLPRTDAAS